MSDQVFGEVSPDIKAEADSSPQPRATHSPTISSSVEERDAAISPIENSSAMGKAAKPTVAGFSDGREESPASPNDLLLEATKSPVMDKAKAKEKEAEKAAAVTANNISANKTAAIKSSKGKLLRRKPSADLSTYKKPAFQLFNTGLNVKTEAADSHAGRKSTVEPSISNTSLEGIAGRDKAACKEPFTATKKTAADSAVKTPSRRSVNATLSLEETVRKIAAVSRSAAAVKAYDPLLLSSVSISSNVANTAAAKYNTAAASGPVADAAGGTTARSNSAAAFISKRKINLIFPK